MVRLQFEALPEEVRSSWPFVLHVLTLDAAGEPDTAYEGHVCLELVEGEGQLRGQLEELASGGQADFLSLSYDGPGPFRLSATVTAGAGVDSGPIQVRPTSDELAAQAALGGPYRLQRWLAALEAILSQEGSTTLEASEITKWMLLGGKPAAEAAVRENPQGVTHILNCCEPWCADGPGWTAIHYTGIEAYDEPGYRLLDEHYAASVRPALDAARKASGRCLVHCAMGVNRSAALCAAYLVEAEGMDLLEAVRLLKAKRGCVLGNRSFRLQLLEFAAGCGRLGEQPE